MFTLNRRVRETTAPANDVCAQCGTEKHPRERRCRHCGALVRKARSGNARFIAKVQVLISLLQPLAKISAIISSRISKTPVPLRIVAGVIAVLIFFPITVSSIDETYRSMSHSYLNSKALDAINAGNSTEALEIMNRVRLQHDKLDPDQQQVVDQALFARSRQLMAGRNYQPALDDLGKISQGFNHKDVVERVEQCKRLARLLGQQTHETPVATPAKSVQTKRETTETKKARTHTVAARPVEAPKPPPQPAAPQAASAISEAPPTPAPTSQKKTDPKTAAPDFVPSDVVRYNELLATYFSATHKDNQEPPSYKEWLKSGKPKF